MLGVGTGQDKGAEIKLGALERGAMQ